MSRERMQIEIQRHLDALYAESKKDSATISPARSASSHLAFGKSTHVRRNHRKHPVRAAGGSGQAASLAAL
jgi:hypothetical protein